MPRFHPEMPRFCHNLLFGRLAARTFFFLFFLLKSKRKRKKAEKRTTTGMPQFGVASRVGVPRNGGRATGDFVAGQIVVPQGFAGDLRALPRIPRGILRVCSRSRFLATECPSNGGGLLSRERSKVAAGVPRAGTPHLLNARGASRLRAPREARGGWALRCAKGLASCKPLRE